MCNYSKYRKKLEKEWDGKSLSDMKIKKMQMQADKNITGLVRGKFKRKGRK